jgi:hypothetical protein
LISFSESHFPSGHFLPTEIREDATRRKDTRDHCQYVDGNKREKDNYVLHAASITSPKLKEVSHCPDRKGIERKEAQFHSVLTCRLDGGD